MSHVLLKFLQPDHKEWLHEKNIYNNKYNKNNGRNDMGEHMMKTGPQEGLIEDDVVVE